MAEPTTPAEAGVPPEANQASTMAEPTTPAEVVHRGIKWRRPEPGRTYWYNEGYRRWVLWSPGQDAPPLPPGWELPAAPGPGTPLGRGGPARAKTARAPAPSPGPRERPGLLRYLPEDAMARRRPMTSPIRWVPIVVAVAIVAIAFYQATRPPAHATRQDIATAEALKGKCLPYQAGGSGSYSTTPVSCRSAGAAVKVVAVLLPSRQVSCPRGAELARLAKPGFVGEPFECLVPVHRAG